MKIKGKASWTSYSFFLNCLFKKEMVSGDGFSTYLRHHLCSVESDVLIRQTSKQMKKHKFYKLFCANTVHI